MVEAESLHLGIRDDLPHRLDRALPPVQERIQRHIDWLREEFDAVDAALAEQMRQQAEWTAKAQFLGNAPGVDRIRAKTLIANLPELDDLDRRDMARLVGVAPLNCDSGRQRGQRIIWAGWAWLRAVLYVGTLVATRGTPPFVPCTSVCAGPARPKNWR
jgi:transposase